MGFNSFVRNNRFYISGRLLDYSVYKKDFAVCKFFLERLGWLVMAEVAKLTLYLWSSYLPQLTIMTIIN